MALQVGPPSSIQYTTTLTTARKTIFSFSKCSEKMIFPEKSHWNMNFLVLSGKMIFLFTKNMILFFRQKMKDGITQKNTWKYHIFFKCSEKMIFPKKPLWNMIFLVLSGKIVFFHWTENERWSFPRNTWKYYIFCITLYISVLQIWHYPSAHFHILLFSEKKTGSLIYRIEIWLLLQIIWLEMFFNKEWSILCSIHSSGVVFRGVLQRQLRKLFVH